VIAQFSSTPEQDLIAFTRRWFRLLADGAWAEACGELNEPNSYDIRWGPDDIRYTVDLSFPPGCRFRREHPEGPRFSNPDTATGGDGRPVIVPLADGSGYQLDHDVPLNGEWSDLTARFGFLKRPAGYAVALQDLHVL